MKYYSITSDPFVGFTGLRDLFTFWPMSIITVFIFFIYVLFFLIFINDYNIYMSKLFSNFLNGNKIINQFPQKNCNFS